MDLRRRLTAGRPEPRDALHEFSRTLALIVDEAELHEVVAAKLREILGIERVAIFLRDGDGAPYRLAAERGMAGAVECTEFAADGRLAHWLRVNETILVLEESAGVVAFLENGEREALARLEASACVPLVAMNRLLGFFVLGGAGAVAALDPVHRERVAALAAQAALACENAALLRERKARLKRLYRAERLATAGELAAGAAHEIRNPLTAIRSAIQYLRAGVGEGSERGVLLGDILAEVDRIDGIVEAMLSFARPAEVSIRSVDLAELLRRSLALTAARARDQAVAVELDVGSVGPRISADPDLLKQVFLNILLNALQAMPDGGRLRVSAMSRGQAVEVRVADTGCGVPPEHIERIFDPFFTTKPEGTGLGLSICHGIVERHGGEIEISSEPGRGTTVLVCLPWRSGRP